MDLTFGFVADVMNILYTVVYKKSTTI